MIRRVARREVVARARDRSTHVGTGVTVLILAAIILLPSLFGGTTTVRVAGDAAVVQAATTIDTVFDVEAVAAAGAADVTVRGDRIVVAEDAPDEAVPLVQEASRRVRAEAPDPPPLTVQRTGTDSEDKQAFAAIALIVLYMQLIGYGFLVATGIVEEKASRIVEILLAVMRPRELLFGKVLGLGLVGLAQLVLIGGAGLALGAASGQVEVGSDELATLPIVLVWFLLGYSLYAGAFALAGSLVSRQEDIQSVTTPLILALLASFFLGFQAVDDPSGGLAGVLTYVPVSAPLVTPVRMIAGDVGALEVLLSAGIVVACTYAVIAFAARVYGTAVLQTGGRVRLRSLTSARTGAR